MQTNFIIEDWIGNVCFYDRQFESFESAELFLSKHLADGYEEDRQEYYIEQINEGQNENTD